MHLLYKSQNDQFFNFTLNFRKHVVTHVFRENIERGPPIVAFQLPPKFLSFFGASLASCSALPACAAERANPPYQSDDHLTIIHQVLALGVTTLRQTPHLFIHSRPRLSEHPTTATAHHFLEALHDDLRFTTEFNTGLGSFATVLVEFCQKICFFLMFFFCTLVPRPVFSQTNAPRFVQELCFSRLRMWWLSFPSGGPRLQMAFPNEAFQLAPLVMVTKLECLLPKMYMGGRISSAWRGTRLVDVPKTKRAGWRGDHRPLPPTFFENREERQYLRW